MVTMSNEDIDGLVSQWTATSGIQRDLIEARLRRACDALKELGRERDAVVKERATMKANLDATQARCTAQEFELRDRRAAAGLNATDPVTPEDRFARDVVVEVYRARQKHPKVYVSALAEEAGEVARAFNDDEGSDRIREEAIHVACVALRLAIEGCSHFALVRGKR